MRPSRERELANKKPITFGGADGNAYGLLHWLFGFLFGGAPFFANCTCTKSRALRFQIPIKPQVGLRFISIIIYRALCCVYIGGGSSEFEISSFFFAKFF